MIEPNDNFILNWIKEIAPSLAPQLNFEDWIQGFEDRYPPELLQKMKEIWDSYQRPF